MLQTLVLGTILAAQALAVPAPELSPEDIGIDLGIYVYRPDGSVSASVVTLSDAASPSVFHAGTPCMFGQSDGPSEIVRQVIEKMHGPIEITHRWQVSSELRRVSSREAVVRFTWRRTFSDGRQASGPSGAIEATLHPGDRVAMDTIATTESFCPRVALEARFVVRGTRPVVRPSGARAEGTGVVGARAARATGPKSGTPTVEAAQRALDEARELLEQQQLRPMVDVDLWLVRRRSDGREESQHQRIRGVDRGRVFSFNPVAVVTSAGESTVEVSGSVAIKTLESGERQLLFAIGRNVTLPSNRRTNASDSRGSTAFIGALPKPYDVLSFEMPPVQVVWAATGDQFSVRVQVTPVERR